MFVLFCMAEQIWLFSNQFQMQDLILFLKHFKNDVTLHLVNMPAFHDYCYELSQKSWRVMMQAVYSVNIQISFHVLLHTRYLSSSILYNVT